LSKTTSPTAVTPGRASPIVTVGISCAIDSQPPLGGPIRAYSPPLWRMGAYAIEADGTLRRTSISYAEELRPVGAEAA